jgi:hypothetical protein
MSIYQITLKQTLLAQQVRNVFYYETTVGDPSDSEWGDVADEIRADLVSDWAPNAVNDWSFDSIDVRRVDTAGLLSREFTPTAGALAGSSPTDSVASQICLLVSVKGTTTKPNRARSYLAGMNEDNVVNSLVGSGTQSNGESFIDNMSALNSGGTNPLQRVAAQWNAGHTQVTVTNNISGSASKASPVPATQRRRRIGVGI